MVCLLIPVSDHPDYTNAAAVFVVTKKSKSLSPMARKLHVVNQSLILIKSAVSEMEIFIFLCNFSNEKVDSFPFS